MKVPLLEAWFQNGGVETMRQAGLRGIMGKLLGQLSLTFRGWWNLSYSPTSYGTMFLLLP